MARKRPVFLIRAATLAGLLGLLVPPAPGEDTPAVFRPLSGLWSIRHLTRRNFGTIGDIPFHRDYDGDGTRDFILYRDGIWIIDATSAGSVREWFGRRGDLPVPEDYRGNGRLELAVYRPSTGLWAARGLTRFHHGRSEDLPLPADYDGDGTVEAGIYRPDSSFWAVRGVTRCYFGRPGDQPLTGDFAGNGTVDLGIYRPEYGLWAVRGVTRAHWGRNGDVPVPGDYAGRGGDDLAVYRPESGLWAVRGVTRIHYGRISDCPLKCNYGSGMRRGQILVVYGDNRSGTDTHEINVANIRRRSPEIVIHTGDMILSDNDPGEWGRYTSVTAPIKDLIRPCPGNHEAPYNVYYSLYSGLYGALGDPNISPLCYSFSLNGVHFVSLDSNNRKITPDQLAWLENDLASHRSARWTLVFFHHPPYGTGSHGSNLEAREKLVPVLERHNVDLVFNGHNHGLERTYPIRNNSVSADGVVYVTTAGGGAPLSTFGGAWFTATAVSAHHYLELAIQGYNLRMRAYDLSDQIIESYTMIQQR